MALIDDFNDNYFNEIVEFYHGLVSEITDEFGEKPTIEDIVELTTWGIRSLPDDSMDGRSPYQIENLKIKYKAKKKVAPSIGDLIAIPISPKRYALAVYLSSSRFGDAFGIFKDTHVLRPNQDTQCLEPLFSTYTGRDFVIEGKWPKLGHHPKLVELFDATPPIYHSKMYHPDDEEVGPYGSAEYINGELRKISQEEAIAVGLLDRSYSNARLEEDLEKYLFTVLQKS
jgi:hypothetical protein